MAAKKDPRSGKDRRKVDLGPPPRREDRRRAPERRLPEVREVTIDDFVELEKANLPNEDRNGEDA